MNLRSMAIAACFFIAACANTPDTMRERLAAADLSYQAALLTLETLVDNGTVTGDLAAKAEVVVVNASNALDAAHIAIVSSSSDMELYINAAIQAVNLVIEFVKEKENESTSSLGIAPGGNFTGWVWSRSYG